MEPDELNYHRFGITIDSIYYYSAEVGTGCAVLLNTCFTLREGEKLGAVIPKLEPRDSYMLKRLN